MASVYILYSDQLKRHYIGSCLDLTSRLNEHKNKLFFNSFTSKAEDWSLIFSIINLSYSQARNIETHIKKMKSTTYIKNLTIFPEMTERLKTRYK